MNLADIIAAHRVYPHGTLGVPGMPDHIEFRCDKCGVIDLEGWPVRDVEARHVAEAVAAAGLLVISTPDVDKIADAIFTKACMTVWGDTDDEIVKRVSAILSMCSRELAAAAVEQVTA